MPPAVPCDNPPITYMIVPDDRIILPDDQSQAIHHRNSKRSGTRPPSPLPAAYRSREMRPPASRTVAVATCPNEGNLPLPTRSPYRYAEDVYESELSEYGIAMMRAAREIRCHSIHIPVEATDPTSDSDNGCEGLSTVANATCASQADNHLNAYHDFTIDHNPNVPWHDSTDVTETFRFATMPAEPRKCGNHTLLSSDIHRASSCNAVGDLWDRLRQFPIEAVARNYVDISSLTTKVQSTGIHPEAGSVSPASHTPISKKAPVPTQRTSDDLDTYTIQHEDAGRLAQSAAFTSALDLMQERHVREVRGICAKYRRDVEAELQRFLDAKTARVTIHESSAVGARGSQIDHERVRRMFSRSDTPTSDYRTQIDCVHGKIRPTASVPSIPSLVFETEDCIDNPEPQHCVNRALPTTSHIGPHPIPDDTDPWAPSPTLVSLKRRAEQVVRRIGENTTRLEKDVANVTRRLDRYAKSPSISAGCIRDALDNEEGSREVHRIERANGS